MRYITFHSFIHGVLMRRCLLTDDSSSPNKVIQPIAKQIILPPAYRPHVLSLAHYVKTAGHLGRTKITFKLLQYNKYISVFDYLKGYWQLPLTDRAREVSAFCTPRGLWQYKVAPFGMRNSGATFQSLINRVTWKLEKTEAYVEDVAMWADSWQEHLGHNLFIQVRAAGLGINLGKSNFGKPQVLYLGHEVDNGTVKPNMAEVDDIALFPSPTDRKYLMRFLGMAGFFRRFCQNFADVVAPLTNLLKMEVKFIWTPVEQETFEMVKSGVEGT